MVDHHVSNDRYGTINVIDPNAAASGVLVRRLIDRLGLPLNDAAAVCLYAALVCDTGRFQYETTCPDVFALAGELVGLRRAGRASSAGRSSRSTGSPTCSCSPRRSRTRELVREQSFVWTVGDPGHARAATT